MPFTNFPQGFAAGLSVRGLPLLQTHPGQIFWLNNSSVLNPQQRAGSDGNRGTFLDPFATLAGALAQCLSGRGDIIMVGSNHAENISDATTTAMSLAGVAVIGVGTGAMRPTFTFDTANTATIPVSAASCTFQNCVFVANFLTIAAPFTLTTAKDFCVQNCEFRDTAANKNFANLIKSTGAANTVDGLLFNSNTYWSIGTTFNTAILTANDIDRATWSNNYIGSINTTDLASLAIVTAGVLTGLTCEGNVTVRKNTTSTVALISVGGSTSSGLLRNNFCRTLDTATNVLIVTTAGFACQGNSLSGVLSAQGFPIPALDS